MEKQWEKERRKKRIDRLFKELTRDINSKKSKELIWFERSKKGERQIETGTIIKKEKERNHMQHQTHLVFTFEEEIKGKGENKYKTSCEKEEEEEF